MAQDLEEDRIDFVRTSFWDYANGVSTICVVDDEVRNIVSSHLTIDRLSNKMCFRFQQCENIRKALERCETNHDVAEFARQARTGNEIYGLSHLTLSSGGHYLDKENLSDDAMITSRPGLC